MIPKLQWGLASAVPDNAVSSWGTRAIVYQDGYVDLVPDRTDSQGSDIIHTVLNTEFTLTDLRAKLGEMLRSGQVSTRRRRQFEIYTSPRLTVVGDIHGSAGYCYIAAWVAPDEAADEVAARAMDVIDKAVSDGTLPG